tara:strand:+ start:202 stop:1401 length:1200 start_codon:yes stop_codon:yes gene_type:complete
MQNKTIKDVNKIYSKQNPSENLQNLNQKKIEILVNNRKNFFLEKLKLPSKIFQNSNLLDLGCGSGQNTIFYDWNGSNCTLVEYDKRSFLNAKKLFEKFSKNEFKIYNKDLFKFKSKKKFDFVVSNGVAHHTHDIKENIKIAINFLKSGGMLILGIGETNGFFQRHFQRYILYNLSSNEEEIIKFSKILFKENLQRGKKLGGRTEKSIIYDTYLNPKIETLSFNEVKKLFKKNKLYLYSLDEDILDLETFYNTSRKQFSVVAKKNDYFPKTNFLFNSINNFSLTKEKSTSLIKNLNKINKIQHKLTNSFNDQSFNNIKKTNSHRLIKKYLREIKDFKNIDLIDKKNLIQFVNEINSTLEILKTKDKGDKIKKLKNIFKKHKLLFRKFNGKGMNYFVGFKY